MWSRELLTGAIHHTFFGQLIDNFSHLLRTKTSFSSMLVEAVASCLIKIAERVCHSPDMLDELSKHGLIHQATHLIDLNSHTTLCQPVYTGLIGLLVKLVSGSMTALRTLFELNISSILKDILSTYNLSHGMPSSPTVDGHSNQAHEVLKLMNELLPVIARNQGAQLASAKEAFLADRRVLLQKIWMGLLPLLIQVVRSGGDLNNCCAASLLSTS